LTTEPPLVCPHCGAERVRNGTRKVIFHDVPQHGQPAAIEWRRQKFLCRRCSRSSHDGHPAFDERHAVTSRFIDWVSDEGTKVTFSSLSKLSGVNEKVIRQIFGAAGKATNETTQIEMLGIELIKVAGSLYPALIDIQKRAILNVFSSEGALLDHLGWYAGNEFQSAAIVVRDINLPDNLPDGLQRWLSPTAEHLISRSSLHRSVLMAMEAEAKPFFRTQSAGPDLALFRKRKPNLGRTSQNRLTRWQDRPSSLYQIYHLKEDFLNKWSFYKNPTDSEWAAWKGEAYLLGLDLSALIKRIDANREAIEGYTRHHILCFSYPDTLAKTQNIEKAATHSFSASRAILLQSQGKKGWSKKRVFS
jgi:hypothetical protein